ncbi:E3 ubiquitin-protein ligase mbr2 [Thalictrum thalictroides]|uniref:RING-type E3 ubiquitin transferase n=1 Tax=Thalictrum thalictroides TaxID=46969 RepID=A0A7J6VQF0_THATH|nr:E3 ubiquitin-protein ligase mbr2 [Thalictrum thalictroides]
MDGYSGKRPVGGFGIAGKGPGLSLRDASNHDDQSVHCNRLVCSNRKNFSKSPQVGNSDRDKPSSSFRTNGKALMGSSSKAYSAVNNFRKVTLESQGPSSHKGTLSADTNIHMEKVSSESSSSTEKFQIKVPAAKNAESGPLDGSLNKYEEVESYRSTSSSRSQKQNHRWSGQAIQETSLGSSTRHSFGPRNTGHAAKNVSHGPGFSLSRSSSSMPHSNRYGLRNLGCTSISDVLPPDSNHNGRTEMVRRSPDRDCSSAKGKNTGTSSTAGNSGIRKSSLGGHSLSLSERPAQPTSRRTRYWIPSRNEVTSVRTRRTINEDNRSRVSEHGNNNNTLRIESPIVIPQPLQNDLSLNQLSSSFSQQSLPELRAVGQNLCVQVGGRNESVGNSPIPHPQDGSARQFSGISIDRDGYRRYNRDGIAEVLLALERIEHDEELTYEQLLVLETNLFLSGLGFRDQHREMRLDIDNMSYEELLALGEKMGTVSTGLTEEQLSKCLKRSFFMPELLTVRIGGGGGGDDVKCSVCQEEYAERDEVGTLQCDHHYHLVCIHQWLRLKNWCPICKAPAANF